MAVPRGVKRPQGDVSWDAAPWFPVWKKKPVAHGWSKVVAGTSRDHCSSIRVARNQESLQFPGGGGVSIMSDMQFACQILQKCGLQSELRLV